MAVFTAAAHDRRILASRWAMGSDLVVVLLCAAWCDTCNEFRATYERLADARPEALFVWLDVEDDHEVRAISTSRIFRRWRSIAARRCCITA